MTSVNRIKKYQAFCPIQNLHELPLCPTCSNDVKSIFCLYMRKIIYHLLNIMLSGHIYRLYGGQLAGIDIRQYHQGLI